MQIEDELEHLLQQSGCNDPSFPEFAAFLDNLPLALSHLRQNFTYPTHESLGLRQQSKSYDDSDDPIYFAGNSLGLMPIELRSLVQQELDVWADRGVMGHFSHPYKRPWKDIAELVQESMAKVVGAQTSEVAVMGSLTSNLHTLLSTFYRPKGARTKILFERKAFPSDQYAFASQARLHGLSPSEHLISMTPREGEHCLRTEDILRVIEENKDELALIMFPGVQYYTGQYFDIEAITAKGHEVGACVGWDLAHAVGNLPMQLHDWKVDFACWCNYKYLNAGPGAIAGIFVHSDARIPATSTDNEFEYPNRLAGWWGHNSQTRFKMDPEFDPIPGAAGFQLSNPSVLNVVSLLASLNLFDQTTMGDLRHKSTLLTRYLELLLQDPLPSCKGSFTIITPSDIAARGAQLSILFQPSGLMQHVMATLLSHAMIGDEREPDVIRLAPIPMYNTFEEVRLVANVLRQAVVSWPGTENEVKDQSAANAMKQTT